MASARTDGRHGQHSRCPLRVSAEEDDDDDDEGEEEEKKAEEEKADANAEHFHLVCRLHSLPLFINL